ncbi:Hypothetical_protein [Hexamita inflata]|uniref:Hypothetical_protein n=1 Tax=Hexamita inflata TaxID=28002 RepID=A0AA86PMM9_9EUKA|nr:Hypothetical protein HINF_LOCUS25870 [Hexamita inflata]
MQTEREPKTLRYILLYGDKVYASDERNIYQVMNDLRLQLIVELGYAKIQFVHPSALGFYSSQHSDSYMVFNTLTQQLTLQVFDFEMLYQQKKEQTLNTNFPFWFKLSICDLFIIHQFQPFKQKSIVSETHSLRRSGSKLSYQYIPTQQDLPSLNSAVPPAGFEFQKMKNISLLLQVVTVRTSSDTSSFTDKQSCYIKCSSQLNSTYVQNSSRIWNSVILISFGYSDFNLLLLRYIIKTHI